MSTSTGYEARLHRIGRFWAVDIPDVGIQTQCRTLDEAEDMARDAITRALGIEPDAIAVELVVPEFAPLLQRVLDARGHRGAADAAEQQALADAARTLVEDLRVSQGDAGRLLGLSHEEVSQLSSVRGSVESRPWQLGGPTRSTTGTSGFGARSNGRTPSTVLPEPEQHRQKPVGRRPGWAIAEDGD